MANKIEVKETVLGTHCWSNCPHEEVKFLQNEHHHDFTIRVSCEVEHDDRDIEFIMLRITIKKFIEEFYSIKNYIVRFGSRSCEMISNEIKDELIDRYGDKNWKVNVSEDEVYRGGNW
jgi:6-pyruvoyl-tetrahydropterin synthase